MAPEGGTSDRAQSARMALAEWPREVKLLTSLELSHQRLGMEEARGGGWRQVRQGGRLLKGVRLSSLPPLSLRNAQGAGWFKACRWFSPWDFQLVFALTLRSPP
jgi:hypothetical protein